MKHPSRLLGRLLLNPKPIHYKLHKNPFPFGTKKIPVKPTLTSQYQPGYQGGLFYNRPLHIIGNLLHKKITG
jgi:hypothetical protein